MLEACVLPDRSSSSAQEVSMIDGNAERGAPPAHGVMARDTHSETAVAAAAIGSGETVLELGSGAGFDSFLAARQAGPAGRVIGIEPTPAVVARARANARAVAARNVEFRVGELEHLPVADGSVDVILSTNVSAVSPDKPGVIAEALRMLRSGGRLAIRSLLDPGTSSASARTERGAVAMYTIRAARIEEMRALIRAAGFHAVTIHSAPPSREIVIHAVKADASARCCRPEACS
jgi:arsenite methyltransferase